MGATGLALPGMATAADSTQLVEVTATRVRSGDASMAPVQVMTADDIRRSGASSLRELLDAVSASGGGTSDIDGVSSFAAGSSGASLRYLGKQATLVLLNSRRVAPYPLADYSEVFSNLDSLPFEAIDRIEILKGGASALYGSDAIAGVVNIITRTDWRGLQLRASRQQSLTSGRFGEHAFAVTAGFGGSGTGSTSVLADLELYRRDGLMWRDVLHHVNTETTSLSPSFGSGSTFSWPGNVIAEGAGAVAGCTTTVAGLCLYDRYARFEAAPAARRANLLVSIDHRPSATQRLFAEVLAASTQTDYRLAFPIHGNTASTSWVNPSDQSVQTLWFRGLPASHPLNTVGEDDVPFRYRFVDAPSKFSTQTHQYRVLVGLSDRRHGWNWEAATGLMGGATRFEQAGSFSASGFRQVIGDTSPSLPDTRYLSREYVVGQVNAPEVIARLFPSYGYRGRVTQWFADLKATGSVRTTTLGRWDLAAGGELRRERFTVDPSTLLRQGDIVGNGLSAADASRWLGAVFGEVAAPVTTVLQMQLAARWDHDQRFGGRLSPRVSAAFKADDTLKFRAMLESGYRAPNLLEGANSTKFSFENGLSDPRRCPQALALANDLYAQASGLPESNPTRVLLAARAETVLISECSGSVGSLVRHNPDLEPETSRSTTLGLVFDPRPGSRFSVDAWRIVRRNEIGRRTSSELLAAESTLADGTIVRQPLDQDGTFTPEEQLRYGVRSGPLRSIQGRFENTSRTAAHGVDVALQMPVDAWPGGRWSIHMDAAYLGSYRVWQPSLAGWGENLAGRESLPRWRVASGVALASGSLEHSLRALTTSATSLQRDHFDANYSPQACVEAGFTVAQCRVGSWTRWDYAVQWAPHPWVTVSAHVYNVFARRKPIGAARWANEDGIGPPTTEDAKGRMLKLSVQWRL